jgi:hypothetical protein
VKALSSQRAHSRPGSRTYARTRPSFFIHRHLGAAAFSRAPSIVYFLSRATARADAARSRVISTPGRSKRAAIAQAFHTNDCAAAAQRGAPLPVRGCPRTRIPRESAETRDERENARTEWRSPANTRMDNSLCRPAYPHGIVRALSLSFSLSLSAGGTRGEIAARRYAEDD